MGLFNELYMHEERVCVQLTSDCEGQYRARKTIMAVDRGLLQH
jgi:hypothetical protein